jgi:hypothetical protein
VKAVFIELPAFERHRDDYLDDDGFAQLQVELMVNPVAGDLFPIGVPPFPRLLDQAEMRREDVRHAES